MFLFWGLFTAGLIFRSCKEVVWFCSSSKSEGKHGFCWIHVLKAFVLSNSSGVSGDWMNPMERADFPEELRQLCPLLPINTGGAGHGYMLRAMLARPSVVCSISVLHLSPVRTVLGIIVWGLWQENGSVISQTVFINSNTFPCIMLFLWEGLDNQYFCWHVI